MTRFYTILVILFALSFMSCNGSKSLTKKGVKLEEAGMIREASDKYYYALLKKRGNVDAQIGMKNTGQLVLNEMLSDFASKKNFGEKRDAVNAYHKAVEFKDKVAGVGVQLDIAEFYKQDYEAVKLAYMDDLYEEGTSLLEEERFGEAENKFKEICQLDPNYKDANELQNIAYVEPLYQEGVGALESGLYRSAYTSFDKIKRRVRIYKDAVDLREEALKLGKFPIAVFPFENGTSEQGLDAKMSAYALEALTSIDDPFLSIVDRDNLATILEEQQLGMTGVFNDETAVSVGELTGAKAILTGTVLNYREETGNTKKYNRKGYEKYKVKKTDSEGNVTFETKYKEINYKEYYNFSRVSLSIQYKLISLETGEILFTKISELEDMDEVRYAMYDGDRKNLFPAKTNGQVNTSSSARKELMRLLDSRKKLKSLSVISGNLFDAQAHKIEQAVANELMDIIK